MLSQLVPVFITSLNTRNPHIERNITPQRKPQKDKILETPSAKQVVAKARHFSFTNFVDKLVNVLDATFLQGIKDHVEYKDRTFAYHYHLSVIFRRFY